MSALDKISGSLYLLGAFLILTWQLFKMSEEDYQVSFISVIFNLLCVILLSVAGVFSFLPAFKIQRLMVVVSYLVFNVIGSIFFAFNFGWWESGFLRTLNWMTSFILPTNYLNNKNVNSIVFDLANLAVIAGLILMLVSIKFASSQNSNSNFSNKVPVPQAAAETTFTTEVNVSTEKMPSIDSQELASPGVRLGSYLLEQLFTVITLGIGWLVWSFIVWGKGTTPGHEAVRLFVVSEKTGQIFTWGQMFVREFLVKGLLIPVLSVFTLGIIFLVDSLMVVRDDRKTLHDRICGSIVVQR